MSLANHFPTRAGDVHSQIDEAVFVQKGDSTMDPFPSGKRATSRRDGSISPTSPRNLQFEGRQLDHHPETGMYEYVPYQTTWPGECE